LKALRELMDLHGRVALVTGGAGYLGQAYCEALAELGAEVCILDVSADRGQRRAEELSKQFGTRFSAVAADISSEDQVASAIDQALAVHGHLDILVNNAAYPPNNLAEDGRPLREQSLVQWQANLDVMLTGTFLVTRACVPHLGRAAHGAVVNVASIYGLVGPDMNLYESTDMGNPAHYAAAKGGIVQLTRYLATTLAPTIRVNCIAPGGIWRNQPESFIQRYCARTPMGRMATEGDLKGALGFLASDLSEYVTGQVIAVDGGWTAW
jgi:NAD(P)-dependent dehydrogenase (short-subunit alcohol dehydrogenase family)